MTYWHMQLHPNWKKWGKELELLEKKALIGLGTTESNIAYINFKNDMKIGDIVLIKRGSKPLALVKVIGSCEDIRTNNDDRLDWFRYRRKIEILSTNTKDFSSFPQPRMTLQKAINEYTLSYKYIDNWYKNYINKEKTDTGLKLHSIKIDDYKVFNHFEIDFLDEKQKPLPLVVIVGKNGTGKTTLFDWIYEDNEQNIIYLKAGIVANDEVKKLEQLFLDYVDYFIYEKALTSKDGYDFLKEDFDEIFKDFELGFEFHNIDYKNKKPTFVNKKSNTIKEVPFQLQSLSTGEKTLLSKIFYLYLEQPKNKVILIDEPELSLHPSWQNKVISIYEKFAKINNNQIIIATHSPHILTSVDNKYIRVLKKDDNGNIKSIKDNLYANGRDMNSILFDIMGEVAYRPQEFNDTIDEMYEYIDKNKYHDALKIFNKLKNSYGEKDTIIIEAKMALDMMEPEFKI